MDTETETEYTLIGTDEKYGGIYVLSKTISPAHEGEPCFVLRGRDRLALEVVEEYDQLSRDRELPTIMHVVDAFEKFGHDNPDLVRYPD